MIHTVKVSCCLDKWPKKIPFFSQFWYHFQNQYFSSALFLVFLSVELPSYLVLFPVNIGNNCMRQEDVMSNYVRLSCWVASRTDRTPAWGFPSNIISLKGECMRLVERDPILHSIAKFLKASLGKNRKVLSVIDLFKYSLIYMSIKISTHI